MSNLTKLDLNILPNFLTAIPPKLSLNKIEKRVAIAVAVIFSAIAMAFFVVFYFKNRKVVKIKDEEEIIDFKNLNEHKSHANEKVKEINKEKIEKEENKIEEKKTPASSPVQLKEDQVSAEKEKQKEVIQKPVNFIPQPTQDHVNFIPQPTNSRTYEKHEIKQFVEIFYKQQKSTREKADCEAYFKTAIHLPVYKIKIETFYSVIKGHSEIVDMMFNAAIERLNNYKTDKGEKKIISKNFSRILKFLYTSAAYTSHDRTITQSFFNFLNELMKYVQKTPWQHSSKIFLKTIEELFVDGDNTKNIALLILHTTLEPIILIESLLKLFNDNNKKELMGRTLPTIKDAEQLEKIYNITHHIGIDLFSKTQIDTLFKYWIHKNETDKEAFYVPICGFLLCRIEDKSILNIEIIKDVLKDNPEINLKKLIDKYKKHFMSLFFKKNTLVSFLSGFYFIRHLENKNISDNEKMTIMHEAIDFTDSVDDRIFFAQALAMCSSNDQLEVIVEGFRTYEGQKQIPIENFLKSILRNGNTVRIELAFKAYWTTYDVLNANLPHTEEVLLEEIDTEDALIAVYQSIQCLPDDKKDKIKTFLREGFDVGYKIKRVKLSQDVINRIVL